MTSLTHDPGNLSGKIDSSGVMLQDLEIASNDGVAVLNLAKGTKALDASGRPLESITVTPELLLTPWYNFSLYKSAYGFQPKGAAFDPPVTLTFKYNPSDIPVNANETLAVIGYFDPVQSAWIELKDVEVNTVLKRVSATIEHLGTYALAYAFPLS